MSEKKAFADRNELKYILSTLSAAKGQERGRRLQGFLFFLVSDGFTDKVDIYEVNSLIRFLKCKESLEDILRVAINFANFKGYTEIETLLKKHLEDNNKTKDNVIQF